MALNDLLVSYKRIETPSRTIPEFKFPESYQLVTSDALQSKPDQEDVQTPKYYTSTVQRPKFSSIQRWNSPYRDRNAWITDLAAAYRKAGVTNDNAIKMLIAQDAQESGWGRSAQGKFNFGNLTTGAKWKGDYVRGNDHDAKGNPIKQKFRSYNSMDEYAADKLQFLKRLYDFDENDDIDTFTAKLTGKNKGKRRYAEARNYATSLIRVFNSFKAGGVIRKYQNAGTIVADNTRVVKPIIQERVPRSYQISEQPQFVQDNRSDWERQSDNYKRQQQENKTLYNNQHLWNWSAPFNNTRVTKDNAKAMFDFNKSAGMSTFAVGMEIANPVATATSMAGSMVGAGIGDEVAGEKGSIVGGLVGGLFGFSPKRVGKPTTSRQSQSNLVYGSKINGNMPKITQAEAENANIDGFNEAQRFLFHPVVSATATKNSKLAKRLSMEDASYIDGNNRIYGNSSLIGFSRLDAFPESEVRLVDMPEKGRIFGSTYRPIKDIIEYSYNIKDYPEAVQTAIHENLHKGRYGTSPVQMLKVRKLFDSKRAKEAFPENSEYLFQEGEGATNTNDVRMAMGIKLGQEYPGYTKFKKQLDDFNSSNDSNSFISKSFKQDTPRDYKRIWDALTGRYFMLPALFGLSQTFNIQNDEK